MVQYIVVNISAQHFLAHISNTFINSISARLIDFPYRHRISFFLNLHWNCNSIHLQDNTFADEKSDNASTSYFSRTDGSL